MYHKIFNKNDIRVNYSCLENMEKKNQKNKSTKKPKQVNNYKQIDPAQRPRSYCRSSTCLLDGKCLV